MTEARELIRRVPEQTPERRARQAAGRGAAAARRQAVGRGRRRCWPQANKAFPDDADLLYEQAMIDEKLDRVDEMERLLRRVIELKPDHQHAYNALGYSLAERNIRLPEARTLIQKALELSPGEPFITDSLGWVEYRLGNRDEAIRLLRDAYQARPDPEIAAHLGEVLWVAGQRRRGAPRLARGALARRRQRRAARDAGAAAGRSVIGAAAPRRAPRRSARAAARGGARRRAARRAAARRVGDGVVGRASPAARRGRAAAMPPRAVAERGLRAARRRAQPARSACRRRSAACWRRRAGRRARSCSSTPQGETRASPTSTR